MNVERKKITGRGNSVPQRQIGLSLYDTWPVYFVFLIFFFFLYICCFDYYVLWAFSFMVQSIWCSICFPYFGRYLLLWIWEIFFKTFFMPSTCVSFPFHLSNIYRFCLIYYHFLLPRYTFLLFSLQCMSLFILSHVFWFSGFKACLWSSYLGF